MKIAFWLSEVFFDFYQYPELGVGFAWLLRSFPTTFHQVWTKIGFRINLKHFDNEVLIVGVSLFMSLFNKKCRIKDFFNQRGRLTQVSATGG